MIRHIFFILLLGILGFATSCKKFVPAQTPEYPSKSYYYVVAHRTILDNEGNLKGQQTDTILTSGSIRVTSDSTVQFFHYGQTHEYKGKFNDDKTFSYVIRQGDSSSTGLIQFTIGMSASFDNQFNCFIETPARQQNVMFYAYKAETAHTLGMPQYNTTIIVPVVVEINHNTLTMSNDSGVLLKGGVEWCGEHTWVVYPDDSGTSYWVNKSKTQLMITNMRTGKAEVYELKQ